MMVVGAPSDGGSSFGFFDLLKMIWTWDWITGNESGITGLTWLWNDVVRRQQ